MRGILAIFVSTTLEAGTQITTINGLLTVFEIPPNAEINCYGNPVRLATSAPAYNV